MAEDRLVEEHAQEIASLRADRVLAEADTVLSMALQHLDPAPALPPARDVPTPETTSPSSSDGPTATPWPAAKTDVPLRSAAPTGDDGRSSHDMAGTYDTAGHAASAPDTASTRTQAPRTSGAQHSPEEARPQPSLKEVKIVTAVLGAVLVSIFSLSWAMDWPGGHGGPPKATTSATTSRSARASASPLPGKPAKDPVADIADQDVNTAAVMKLRPCTKSDTNPSIRSLHNTYAQGEKVRIKLTIKADDHGQVPCRFDAARSRAALTITAAGSDTPLWDSAACTSGHDEHRWIQVARSRPAVVDFVWNRIPNDKTCQQTAHAQGATYLVENTLLTRKSQTSFVLEADDADDGSSPSPSVQATENTDTSNGSSSNGGGSVGGLLTGGNGTQTSDPPASASPSASPSDDTGINGGGENGNGANGSGNGGIFGGPS
ncbi:hypothetical protein M2161_009136 [Streptomyces sp. SAI-133]|uniref:hypothetical protein n=1 Tax=unclassified Streptomyces TaxID=2593676 RepID=UPI002476BF47|nr:hypothetical protein [Streptomyces sp. SAI-133]MDH6589945.1 hypothetical protein [Streptomyces sp. SAI-133]